MSGTDHIEWFNDLSAHVHGTIGRFKFKGI